MTSVALDRVQVGERHRRDLGDLASLARSIETVGLLQPIVLTDDHRLVAGHRRLEACRQLGWATIPVNVVSNLTTAAALLEAERDENVERLEFSPTEMVAMTRALRSVVEGEAKAAQKAGNARGGRGKQVGGKLPPTSPPNERKTREKLASLVGVSGRTLDKAEAVVTAAELEPDVFGDLPEQMDGTGKVDGAFQELQRRHVQREQDLVNAFVDHAVAMFFTLAELDQLIGSLVEQAKVLGDRVDVLRLARQLMVEHEAETPHDAFIAAGIDPASVAFEAS